MTTKFEILYTEYEDYFAHNLAAFIINQGGSVKMNEVFSNDNFYTSDNDYTKLFVFPSAYITYQVVSPFDFVKDFNEVFKSGNAQNFICIDYSAVIDVADYQKCQEAKNYLVAFQTGANKSFKKLVTVDKDLCLDNLFHKKIGVIRNTKLKYAVLNGRYSGELNPTITEIFGKPSVSHLLNEKFSYSDFVTHLDAVDFYVINDAFNEQSAICQICNYAGKPVINAQMSQSNLSKINPQMVTRLLSNSLTQQDLTQLLSADLVDRNALDTRLWSMLTACK